MKVKTRGHVKHNGKWYKDGETIAAIKKEDAERLIQLGVAEEIQGDADSKQVDETEKPKSAK
ncbi:hypothetical protein LG275_03745 [Chryseomicrobium palamuruense]